MSVKRLSSEITSKLRSGIAINSVPRCVDELVLNSLDAGANCVAVRLDLTFFKIRVIDNGRGIRFRDLDLVGSRYATSKCCTLEDLYSTNTFGHRGEALASIREVSQEMTITTRSIDIESSSHTYIKSFRGSASSIERAELQRPSNGTTITVLNFLYNLPVRQGSVREVLDVEIVRRNLEILALVHPGVSFSLYNDNTESYCLRVTKSLSVSSTFGQLYGGSWVSQLKTVNGRRDPFAIEGHIATKGHHNRRLQFVYVHRRRIDDERFQKMMNEVFDRSFEESGLRNCTSFPVYVLFVDCPRQSYDVGLCPSKTIVQFRDFDVLKELLVEVIKKFLSERVKNNEFSGLASPLKSTVVEKREAEILIHDYRHSLHSMAAKRPHPTITEYADECVTPKTLSNVLLNEPPKRPREQTPLEIFKTVPKSCSSGLEGVTPTLYLSDKPKGTEVKFPICMSPAVTSQTTFLGRLMKERDRKERNLKAVADLKRFSYHTLKKNLPITKETSIHREIRKEIEKSTTPSSSCTKKQTSSDPLRPPQKEISEAQLLISPVIQSSLRLHFESNDLEAENVDTSTVVAVTKDVPSLVEPKIDDSQKVVPRNWIIGLQPDENDDQFYLDPTSGNSYFGKPSQELQSHSATIVSSTCLTLDAVYGEENYQSTTNLPSRPWRSKETEEYEQKAEDDKLLSRFSLSNLFHNWRNPILGRGDEEKSPSRVITVNRLNLVSDSFSAVKSQSYTFSRNIFERLQFVSQLDRKFITCLASYAEVDNDSSKSNLLVLFDQHAVHERIRLEGFLKDAGFNNDCEGLKSDVLNPPLSLTFPMEVVRIASNYKSHLAKCGVSVSVDDSEESRLTLHSLPSCFIEREVSECKQQRASVLNDLAKKLVLELTENLQHGLPIRPTMPKVVLNVLKSQACHGALKFGHRLDLKTCKHLMVKLGKCKLPFQCAHGRPSITVLVDLSHVPNSKKVLKPDLHKLNVTMKEKALKII